jgi:threonine/homoserine/homoserine lactone efflux protein
VLKLVGAAYLIYLGVQALWKSRRGGKCAEAPAQDEMTADTRAAGVFRQAFLSNVLNPKAALFFVSVLPQFLDPAASGTLQVLLLGALDIGLGIVWWALFVLLTARLSGLMRRRGPRKVLDRATGTVLVGLGTTLAASG